MAEIMASPTDGFQVETATRIVHLMYHFVLMNRTEVYHCNVSRHGFECIGILVDKWSPVLTVEKLILSIMSLLSDANPDDPMDMDMASLYQSNRQQYDRNARNWTMLYAMPRPGFESS